MGPLPFYFYFNVCWFLEWWIHAFVAYIANWCFCWFPAAMLVPLRGVPTWLLHTKLYKFRQNISPNISHMKNCPTLILAETFVHLPSFISQILDFIYWTVFIFIFDGVTVNTSKILFLKTTTVFFFYRNETKLLTMEIKQRNATFKL